MADALDYRNGRTYRTREEAEKGEKYSTQARWWEKVNDDEIGQALYDTGVALHTVNGVRRMANLRFARQYENSDLDALAGADFATSLVRQAIAGAGLVSLNLSATCIDTLAAKIAKNRPTPRFLTSGTGGWNLQQKAKALEKWARGYFYETKVYEKAPSIFIDGLVFGTGLLQVRLGENGKLEAERTITDEVYVDDADGQYGTPSQLLRQKRISRDVLLEMFPDKAEEIRLAGKAGNYTGPTVTEVTDNMLEVWEGWHLPSGKGAKDGMHVIAINKCLLFKERWKIRRFPFVVFRFKRRVQGFWGKGVPESIGGLQIEANRVMRSLADQLRRKGRGRIYVEKGSQVNPNMLTNGIADIVEYVGKPPIVDSNNAVAPEEINYLQLLRQLALAEVGVSELSAAAKKPSGLDAAVALREYSDIESERFSLIHQAWDQFFMDYTELGMDLVKNQYELKSYKVNVPGRRNVEQVDWKDIDIDESSYVLQIFPSSSLPQTPAARYAKVKEMRQDRFITDPEAKRLLEFPDIEAETNLGNAILDDVDATISAILDQDTPELKPLEPYQNLDLIIERATAAYLYARWHDCDEERLSLLRNLIDDASAKKVSLTMPAASPPALAGPPPGPPMPVPGPGGVPGGVFPGPVGPPPMPPGMPPGAPPPGPPVPGQPPMM